MPLEDIKDMTWAEFQLRSFQYWEDRRTEEMLFREVAYWGYCSTFAFSNQKPKGKNEFWPIGEKKGISNAMKEAFLRARKEYLDRKNG